MDCLVMPVSMLRRCYTGSRLGYRPLTEDGFRELDGRVKVVVGKEKREFLVDPFVLEESPFQVLIEIARASGTNNCSKEGRIFEDMRGQKRMIFVDVDSILFEHMLWLMRNDCSSLLELNLKEIVDFYSQDY